MENPKDLSKAVINSLENSKFKWRTIDGISAETGLPPDVVRTVINLEKENIIQSSTPTEDGKDVFTTMAHYSRNASTLSKILGAFKNRLD
jgi:hypothetical protein